MSLEFEIRKSLSAPAASGGPYLLALAALGLVLALTAGSTAPPESLDVSAPLLRFSAGRAMETLAGLLEEDQPHPIGSPANGLVRDRILSRLDELGYRPRLQRDAVCRPDGAVCAVTENIVGRLEGSEDSKSVLLSAHYDSVAAGPGAGDDGSGVAVLLEVARILSTEATPRNPVLILINDGEEAGLLGAESFVRYDRRAGEVGAVINVEARGTGGRNWMFETSAGGLWLVRAYARSVARPATSSIAYSVYKRLPNDTDLTVYKRAGMEGLGLAFLRDVQRYHTPLDDVPRLSPEALQLQGETVLALSRRLASMDLEAVERGEAVFFDVAGRWTVWWPADWTPWMAGASGLAWLALAIRLWVAGELRAKSLPRVLGQWPAALAAAGAAGFLVGKALDALGVFPTPFVARPEPAMAAFWGFGLAAALMASSWTAGRATARSLWLGGLFWWNLLASVLAVVEPGASYPWLATALVAGVATLALSPWKGSWALVCPVLLAAAVAGVLLFPMMTAVYHALGRVTLPATSLLTGLIVSLLAPLAAGVSRRLRHGVTGALALASLLFAAVAAAAPPFSDSLPRHLNLRYQIDAEPAGARWMVQGRGPIPEDLSRAAGGAPVGERVVPWSSLQLPSFKAPRLPLSPPIAEILWTGERDGGTWTRVRLRSPRGASFLELALPESAVVGGIVYPGFPALTPAAPPVRSGWRRWRFLAVPAEGVEVLIARPGSDGGSLGGYLADTTAGLPSEGAELIKAREPAVPVGLGDLTVVVAELP